MNAYMLDTNVFNRVLDREVDLLSFVGKARFLATHVQIDELRATKNPDRRNELLAVFDQIVNQRVSSESIVLDTSRLDEAKVSGANLVPTESAVWNVSKWGQAKWGDENSAYKAIRAELDRTNRAKPNNVQDALIAETALKNGYMLVTNDGDLSRIAANFSIACTDLSGLVEELSR